MVMETKTKIIMYHSWAIFYLCVYFSLFLMTYFLPTNSFVIFREENVPRGACQVDIMRLRGMRGNWQ